MKMIALEWVCVSIFLALTLSAAPDETQPLAMAGLNEVYSLKGPVATTVTNQSPHRITYGIGVLHLENGRWVELLTNIEDHEFIRKAFKLRTLLGKESVKLTWTPSNLRKSYLIEKGVYRFYVAFHADENDKEAFHSVISKNIGSEVNEHNRQLIFSHPFELK